MTDLERMAVARRRYMAASHAMQSGVATEIAQFGEGRAAANPKHLRTGVNSAMVSDSALATLLIAKGIFTAAEYAEAIADAMEAEVRRYEELLSKALGTAVTLA